MRKHPGTHRDWVDEDSHNFLLSQGVAQKGIGLDIQAYAFGPRANLFSNGFLRDLSHLWSLRDIASDMNNLPRVEGRLRPRADA